MTKYASMRCGGSRRRLSRGHYARADRKAIFHGPAGTAALTLQRRTLLCRPVAFMPEIEKTMIEQNQRFVSVVDGGKVTGAITRTDS